MKLMKNTLMATTTMLLMASSPLAAIEPSEVNNFLASLDITDDLLSRDLSKRTDTEWANFKNIFIALSTEMNADERMRLLIEMEQIPSGTLDQPTFLPTVMQLTQRIDDLDLYKLMGTLRETSREILGHENFLPATLTLSQGMTDRYVSSVLQGLGSLPVKYLGLKNFLPIVDALSRNKNISERIRALYTLQNVSENAFDHENFLLILTEFSPEKEEEEEGITSNSVSTFEKFPLKNLAEEEEITSNRVPTLTNVPVKTLAHENFFPTILSLSQGLKTNHRLSILTFLGKATLEILEHEGFLPIYTSLLQGTDANERINFLRHLNSRQADFLLERGGFISVFTALSQEIKSLNKRLDLHSYLKKISSDVLSHEGVGSLLMRPDVVQASIEDKILILQNFSQIKNIKTTIEMINEEVGQIFSAKSSDDQLPPLDIVSILKNTSLYLSEAAAELSSPAQASTSMSLEQREIDPSLIASSSQASSALSAAAPNADQRELPPLKRPRKDSTTSDID